jgi:hypothetical protein
MARIRIVTKPQPMLQTSIGGIRLNGPPISIVDCYCSVISDDGTEEPLHGVTGFLIDASSPTEEIRVMLTLVDTEFDVQGETDVDVGP